MKSFVVDTSALVRLYVPDGPLPDNTEEAMELSFRGEALVLVPELAWIEAAAVLHKKQRAGFLSSDEVDEIFGAISQLPLETVGHAELVSPALHLARTHGVTVYDAVFMALARDRQADLITADARLAKVWELRPTPSPR